MDGWVVCQRIREITDVPIIMLTSMNRDDEVVKGLELGADDFVSKPASPRQLAARVQAVLRRARYVEPSNRDLVYDDGVLGIDAAQHEVRFDRELVQLSPTEFRLLAN